MSDQHLQVQILPGHQWTHQHTEERQQHGECLFKGWCTSARDVYKWS